MAQFGGSEGSTQGPISHATVANLGVGGGSAVDLASLQMQMEWEDVDAFLDDYLKELGPEAPGPDAFGNFGIDFAPPMGLQQSVLGAWGPSAPAPAPSAVPADSTQQQAATMLTSQLQAQALDSQEQGPCMLLQRAASEAVVQPPTRATRARKGATSAAAAASGGAAHTAAGRGGSSGGRAARESKKELDMKKHLALQEKNRRAQRRFRERQKQRVAELEEQVASLQAQLAAATRGQAAAAAALAPGAAAGQLVLPAVAGGGELMQEDAKREQLLSPRAVVGAQLPATSGQPGSDEEQQALQASFEEGLTLTVREGHPVQLSAQQLAGMTPAELAKHYKAYVNELAGILVESDNPGSAATQERVQRLVDEVCLLSTRTALCNPPGSKHFTLSKVDDVANQPADARVPQIARALDISQPQRRQLGQLRGLFLHKMARIAAERQDVNQQLAGAVPGGTGNRHLAARYLAAHDCARRLRQSLREEHRLVLDFVSTICKHVLSPNQVAQFMIQSYPWTPDCLALCTWVAAEDGDAEALSLLAAEAQSKQAAAAAAAQAASNGGGPQASGGSGSGATLAPAGASGVPTPTASAAMPLPGGGPAGPLFLPSTFGAMPGQPLFGQPGMAAAPFGSVPPFVQAPAGSEAMNNLVGHPWSGASFGMQLPPAGASACLANPLGLPHLAGAGSGGKGGLLAELGGNGSQPISPNVALSSANNG